MTINRPHIPMIIIVALLLVTVAQSAYAHALVTGHSYNPSIRVDSCHTAIVVTQEQATPCCKTAVCHRAIPESKDLSIPEYRTTCHDSHLLISTLRLETPQLRSSEPLILAPKAITQPSHTALTNTIPRQSLNNLRTTILLN